MEKREDRFPAARVARTDVDAYERPLAWPRTRSRLFGVLAWAGAGFAGISVLSFVLFELLAAALHGVGIGGWGAGACVALGLAGCLRRACRRVLLGRIPAQRRPDAAVGHDARLRRARQRVRRLLQPHRRRPGGLRSGAARRGLRRRRRRRRARRPRHRHSHRLRKPADVPALVCHRWSRDRRVRRQRSVGDPGWAPRWPHARGLCAPDPRRGARASSRARACARCVSCVDRCRGRDLANPSSHSFRSSDDRRDDLGRPSNPGCPAGCAGRDASRWISGTGCLGRIPQRHEGVQERELVAVGVETGDRAAHRTARRCEIGRAEPGAIRGPALDRSPSSRSAKTASKPPVRHTAAADGLCAAAAVFASQALGATPTEVGTRSVSASATERLTRLMSGRGPSRGESRAGRSSIEWTAATGSTSPTAEAMRACTAS